MERGINKRPFRIKKIVSTLIIVSAVISLSLVHMAWHGNGVDRMDRGIYFQPKEPLTSDEVRNIMDVVGKMNIKPVLITLVNDAYLPFMYSWLCNTERMGIHKQVLIIASNSQVKETLKQAWPELNVVAISLISSDGDQVFSHVGYIRLMIRRTQILLELLQNGIETFLFEADCLWVKNPLLFSLKVSKYDITFGGITGTSEITGGLMYLIPNKATIETFRELNKMLINLEFKMQYMSSEQFISAAENDQMFLSYLVRKKFAGLKSNVISSSLFADGKWYCMSRKERLMSSPLLINNNWVVGNINKTARAKMWGHWFTNDDNTCNFKQVDNIIDHWQVNVTEPTNPNLYSPCDGNTLKQSLEFLVLYLWVCNLLKIV